MNGFRLQAAAVGFLAAACALHPVVSPDLWWHLASGRWILENGSIPRTDVLTYTITTHPWTNFQWLTDALLALGWRAGGPALLVLGKALLLAVTGAVAVAAARAAGAAVGAAGIAAALMVLAGAERTFVRPEIVSGLCLATTLVVLYRVRTGRRGPLPLLPLLVAVWVNLHSLAFLGPLTIGFHGVLALLDARGSAARRDFDSPAGTARALFVTAGASAVALLANPFGWKALVFPFTLFTRIRGDTAVFERIREFARPLEHPEDPALRFFWILVALLLLSFAGRRFRPARALAVVPFLALALLARRNIPLFAIAAVPVLAANLRARIPAIFPVVLAAGTGVAVLLGASPHLLGIYRDRGVLVEPGLFPEEALAALDGSGVRGEVFHDLDFGGYLVWRDPGRRSFIDGRLEVAGREWLERYVNARESAVEWQRLVSSWSPGALLLGHAGRGDAAFLRAVHLDRSWRPWLYTAEAVLLLDRAQVELPPPVRPTAETWERLLREDRGPAPHAGTALDGLAEPLHRWLTPRPAAAAVRRAIRLANLCMTMQWLNEGRAGYEAVLAAAPNDPEAYFQIGICERRLGRPDRARDWWERGLRLPRLDAESRGLFEEALAALPPAPVE